LIWATRSATRPTGFAASRGGAESIRLLTRSGCVIAGFWPM
jgi:hypothetical protein